MTFDELKDLVLDRAKRLELCESYQQALVATSYSELIRSSVSLIEWSFQSGIVDDALLDEFPEADLNDGGIYITDTTITDPQQYIYLLRGTHTVNITGDNRCRIRAMAGVTATINVQNNAFLDFKSFDEAVTTINLSNKASLLFECIQDSVTTIVCNNETALNGKVSDRSSLFVSANDTAYAGIKAFNDTVINYTVSGSAEVEVRTYQKATINAT